MATYRFYGSKRAGERTSRVVLEGTSTNPTRFLQVGGDPVELSDEEAERLLSRGLDLRQEDAVVEVNPEPPTEESTHDNDESQPSREEVK